MYYVTVEKWRFYTMSKKVAIILTQEHPKLGPKGQVLSVALGYALNFLIPQGLAVLATQENLKRVEHLKVQLEKERQIFLEKQKPLAEKLKKQTVKLVVKAQEEGSLFGSVGAAEIAEKINAEFKTQLEPKAILLDKPFKKTGKYEVEVTLAPEIKTTTKIEIAAEE